MTGTDESFIRDTCANLVVSAMLSAQQCFAQETVCNFREKSRIPMWRSASCSSSCMRWCSLSRRLESLWPTLYKVLSSPVFQKTKGGCLSGVVLELSLRQQVDSRIPGIHPVSPAPRRPGIMDPLLRGVRGRTADIAGEEEADWIRSPALPLPPSLLSYY